MKEITDLDNKYYILLLLWKHYYKFEIYIYRLGVRWIPIIDAGVKYSGDSGEKGKEMKIFIKSSITGKDLIGCVWPGAAHFLDFNHIKSEEFWI